MNFEMKIVDKTLKALNLMLNVLLQCFWAKFQGFSMFQNFVVFFWWFEIFLKYFLMFQSFFQCFQWLFWCFVHLLNVLYLFSQFISRIFPKFSHLSQCPRKILQHHTTVYFNFHIFSLKIFFQFSLGKFICSEQFFEFYFD